VDAYSIFVRTTRRHALIEVGQRVLAAVSGGADSTALLYFLLQTRRGIPFHLAVAHLDHGQRGRESRADAAFVAGMAREYGLEFYSERLPEPARDPEAPGAVPDAVDGSQVTAGETGATGEPPARTGSLLPEGRLRAARLEFLYRTAADWGAERIALGHTRDDQAETLALNLIRGAGARGLGAMAVMGPPRSLPDGLVSDRPGGPSARIVRPLIDVTRAALTDWLEKRGLPWREDASNEDPHYLRNRVRHELMPLLERLRPGAGAAMARAAHLLQEDDALLRNLAGEIDVVLNGGAAALDAARLRDLPRPLARRVLRQAALDAARREAGGGAGEAGSPEWRPGARQVEEVLDLVFSRRSGRVDLGKGHAALVSAASVIVEAGPGRRCGRGS
jgi:tRNA(Ile)-lysidine synthase